MSKTYTRHGIGSASVRVRKKTPADLRPRTDASAVRTSLPQTDRLRQTDERTDKPTRTDSYSAATRRLMLCTHKQSVSPYVTSSERRQNKVVFVRTDHVIHQALDT